MKHCSEGINPITDTQYQTSLRALIDLYIQNKEISEIYYYGSGCINAEVNDVIAEKFNKHYPSATKVVVKDDLLGSAIAACQHQAGLVCILGTGSIIGYYDGHGIVEKLPSAGYLIGDEGSGFHVAKILLRRYLRNQMDARDLQALSAELTLSNTELIQSIYQSANPRKYLASHSTLIHIINSKERSSILNEVFSEMTKNMIVPMVSKRAEKTHFIGSIAFYFQDAIVENLQKFDIIAGSFQQSAIEGLVQYHCHEKRN